MVRAKFAVVRRNITDYGKFGTSTEVVLQPQYDTTIPEDQRYAQATPCGELKMTVDNQAALDVFKHGTVFYLDFTPVDETSSQIG